MPLCHPRRRKLYLERHQINKAFGPAHLPHNHGTDASKIIYHLLLTADYNSCNLLRFKTVWQTVLLNFEQQGLGWERAKNINFKPATQISTDDSGGEWGGSWAGRKKAWEFAIILKGESEKAGLHCGSNSGVSARLQLKPSQLFPTPPTTSTGKKCVRIECCEEARVLFCVYIGHLPCSMANYCGAKGDCCFGD